MKISHIILLVTMLFVVNATASTDDLELKRRLVGTWISESTDKAQFVSTATYNADGTGTETVRMRDKPESSAVRLTTHWSIKDGVLTLKSITSTDPQLIPVGLELKDRIISITEEKFLFEAYEGYGDAKGQRGAKIRKKAG